MSQITNWSESVAFIPNELHIPESEAEVIELVNRCREQKQHIRVVGSGHSFTRLIETQDVLVSLDKLEGIISVNQETHVAKVGAGTKIKALGRYLSGNNLSQPNLGDVDVQSIAGAISTGTHGSGASLGGIATQVIGLRLITADGEILDCSETEHPDIFKAAQVSMGMLGIITRVTLQCVPEFTLAYQWYQSPLDDVLANLEKLKANRHFEFFWFPHTETTLVKIMNITDRPPQKKSLLRRFNENIIENVALWGFSAVARQFPSQSKYVSKAVASLVSSGEDRTASHETFATTRMVKFQEMEYNIPAEHFEDCLREIKACIHDDNIRVHFPVECRFVAADDIPLSPAYQRESAYIAVHMFKGMEYQQYFSKMEAIFSKYDGRPHWGKMHSRTAKDFRQLYPRWDEFMTIRKQLDPDGLFMNGYLSEMIKS